MKVVIDTNVLLSAALKDRDPEAIILFITSHSDFTWVASEEILAEYKNVLSREKFGLSEEIKSKWSEILDSIIEVVPVELSLEFPRDQKDAKFIACSIIADADFLISGDKDFSDAKKIISTSILSVSQFKKLVCDQNA